MKIGDEAVESDIQFCAEKFHIIMNEMKSTPHLWEDFYAKCVKFNSLLKNTVAASSSLWDSLQNIADATTNTQGSTNEIGASLTRVCIRHKSLENRLNRFTETIQNSFLVDFQEKLEEWKKANFHLEREHEKDFKRYKTEIKKLKAEVNKLSKKLYKEFNPGSDNSPRGYLECSNKLNATKDKLVYALTVLRDTENNYLKLSLTQQRNRIQTFVEYTLTPLLNIESDIGDDLAKISETRDDLLLKTSRTRNQLRPSSVVVVNDNDFVIPPSKLQNENKRYSEITQVDKINHVDCNARAYLVNDNLSPPPPHDLPLSERPSYLLDKNSKYFTCNSSKSMMRRFAGVVVNGIGSLERTPHRLERDTKNNELLSSPSSNSKRSDLTDPGIYFHNDAAVGINKNNKIHNGLHEGYNVPSSADTCQDFTPQNQARSVSAVVRRFRHNNGSVKSFTSARATPIRQIFAAPAGGLNHPIPTSSGLYDENDYKNFLLKEVTATAARNNNNPNQLRYCDEKMKQQAGQQFPYNLSSTYSISSHKSSSIKSSSLALSCSPFSSTLNVNGGTNTNLNPPNTPGNQLKDIFDHSTQSFTKPPNQTVILKQQQQQMYLKNNNNLPYDINQGCCYQPNYDDQKNNEEYLLDRFTTHPVVPCNSSNKNVSNQQQLSDCRLSSISSRDSGFNSHDQTCAQPQLFQQMQHNSTQRQDINGSSSCVVGGDPTTTSKEDNNNTPYSSTATISGHHYNKTTSFNNNNNNNTNNINQLTPPISFTNTTSTNRYLKKTNYNSSATADEEFPPPPTPPACFDFNYNCDLLITPTPNNPHDDNHNHQSFDRAASSLFQHLLPNNDTSKMKDHLISSSRYYHHPVATTIHQISTGISNGDNKRFSIVAQEEFDAFQETLDMLDQNYTAKSQIRSRYSLCDRKPSYGNYEMYNNPSVQNTDLDRVSDRLFQGAPQTSLYRKQ